MLWLGDHLPPPPPQAVIIVFQKMCVKTYMSFGEKNWGEKNLYGIGKRKEMGFWEIGW